VPPGGRTPREENPMYTPREGQWSYAFHRISGLAIFLFLFGHILSTAIVVWGPHGPAMHEKLDAFYRLPIFTLLFHPLLFAAVLYHALNGIRIIVIDWWSESTRIQRPLFYIEMAVLVVGLAFAGFKQVLPEWQEYQRMKAESVASMSQIPSVPPVAKGVR
jgi:succinate dehydrogenase / fumarate reductase cytochrome b subunit